MAEVFQVDGSPEAAVEAAERALAAGECVVLPTDTVYGLAARPDRPAATDRLFETKRRPRDLTLPVLAAGLGDAAAVAVLDERAVALARRFWPGPLTLVLPRSDLSREWDLGVERETVGVRVPANDVALAVLSRTGPLAVTSANPSGRPTPPTCEGVRRALGDAVAVYVCAGPGTGRPSTVVALVGDEPRILRPGEVPAEAILGALAGS